MMIHGRQLSRFCFATITAVILLQQHAGAADVATGDKVTFNRHIAPLVFENCSVCHRPGEVAPFPLLTYADVKKRAELIRTVTADQYMPPWKSVPGHGRFIGERRLKPEQIALVARWVEAGMPEGEAADLPAPPQYRDGWKLGEPDLVLTMAEAFEIPAEGADIYRNFVFDLKLPAGKYLKAAEYRPGNRLVVHHAALVADGTGKARAADAADPAPGYPGSLTLPGRLLSGSIGIWTPGRDPLPLPDRFSMPWPENTDLVMQLHLHPSGKPETEQSSIGLYFTDQPPSQSMLDVAIIDRGIDIPAGEAAFRSRDEITLPVAMNAFGVFPHMHLIGREMKITAHPPTGEPFSLLWINDWDFNWQSFYQYLEPVALPAGTKIVMEAVHDNSAENFRNPFNPPRRITWGEQTTNEMSAAVVQLVPADEAEMPKAAAGLKGRIVGGFSASQATAAKK